MKTAYRVRVCPSCRTKRRITTTSGPNDTWIRQCSRGHVWTEQKPTMERCVEAMKAVYAHTLPRMLNQDCVTWSLLRGTR